MLRIKSSWLKMIIVFSVIVTCVTGTVISSYAAEVSDDANTAEDTNNYEVKVYESDAIPISVEIISADYDAPTDLEGIGTISVQQYLSINDIVVPLYPVFDDMEEAINNISEVSSNVISDIASCYELDMLSEDNWHKYQLSLADYADDDAMESDDNYSYEYAMLDQFFDIYENYECNQEIINMAMELSKCQIWNYKNLNYLIFVRFSVGLLALNLAFC
ncbi:MAG: hypothetical protein LUD14_05165 [Clostridiales bacterium]|nr:hypothetical protein [Clostridiales bacterium]